MPATDAAATKAGLSLSLFPLLPPSYPLCPYTTTTVCRLRRERILAWPQVSLAQFCTCDRTRGIVTNCRRTAFLRAFNRSRLTSTKVLASYFCLVQCSWRQRIVGVVSAVIVNKIMLLCRKWILEREKG